MAWRRSLKMSIVQAFAFASGACEVHALTGDKRHTLKQLLKLLNASGEN
jgi:hypothetical protein